MKRLMRLSGDGIGGALMSAVGALLLWWIFFTGLSGQPALLPRLSVGAMIVGGLWIAIRDWRRAGTIVSGLLQSESAAMFAVVATLALFGWLMLQIGIAVTTFGLLSLIWLVLRIRIGGAAPMILRRAWGPFVLAAAIGMSLYLAFVVGLGVFLPNTLLF